MVDEIKIYNSFVKIKQDISFLYQELMSVKQEISQIKKILTSSKLSAEVRHPADNPAHNFENYALNPQNFHSSTGNEGVPADRQTDRQTTDKQQLDTLKRTLNIINKDSKNLTNNIELMSFIKDLKQDLREKFKTLTKQEFLVFSALYIFSEESETVTYKTLAERINLTESSVRDYISRLEKKGIPIKKQKINNKIIILKIPDELKDITSLDSLSRLNKL